MSTTPASSLCVSQLRREVNTPRGKTTKPWQLADWKRKRKELLKDQCEICGSKDPPLALHHLTKRSRSPEEFARYCSLAPEDVITLCKKCHFMISKGFVLCQQCRKNWHAPRYPTCFDCLPSKRQQEIRERKRMVKVIHPCGKEFYITRDDAELFNEFLPLLEFCLNYCFVNVNDCSYWAALYS